MPEINFYLKEKCDFKDGIFYYLPEVSDFLKKEIDFHDLLSRDEEEIHQLNSLRNEFYHRWFKKYIYQLPPDSLIMEIGSGSGYDLAAILKRGYRALACDISEASVKFVKNKLSSLKNSAKAVYLVADGQNLPLPDNSIDCLYLVASLHHFEDQADLLSEALRILKNGGRLILAMEPSKFMMSFTKLFKYSKKLRVHQGHSEADETHQGYGLKDFKNLIRENGLSKIKIKRVWLLQGFIHYGLEAIFRFFKLKKRVRLPRVIEWPLLILDEILLKIPIINLLNWHWIAVMNKN
jgi:ubiquinone/menaquinone biosynthesis C-methylase UbiE